MTKILLFFCLFCSCSEMGIHVNQVVNSCPSNNQLFRVETTVKKGLYEKLYGADTWYDNYPLCLSVDKIDSVKKAELSKANLFIENYKKTEN